MLLMKGMLLLLLAVLTAGQLEPIIPVPGKQGRSKIPGITVKKPPPVPGPVLEEQEKSNIPGITELRPAYERRLSVRKLEKLERSLKDCKINLERFTEGLSVKKSAGWCPC